MQVATDSSVARARFRPLLALACGAALVAATLPQKDAQAPPGSLVISEPITRGTLPEPVRAKLKEDLGGFEDGTAVTQVVLVKFTIAPGGFFGWHQHGGPVWVVVASGTLTLYDADDRLCAGHLQGPGSSFLDPGDHTHNARNEGTTPVVVYGTFLLPEGGAVRVDAPKPDVCSF